MTKRSLTITAYIVLTLSFFIFNNYSVFIDNVGLPFIDGIAFKSSSAATMAWFIPTSLQILMIIIMAYSTLISGNGTQKMLRYGSITKFFTTKIFGLVLGVAVLNLILVTEVLLTQKITSSIGLLFMFKLIIYFFTFVDILLLSVCLLLRWGLVRTILSVNIFVLISVTTAAKQRMVTYTEIPLFPRFLMLGRYSSAQYIAVLLIIVVSGAILLSLIYFIVRNKDYLSGE